MLCLCVAPFCAHAQEQAAPAAPTAPATSDAQPVPQTAEELQRIEAEIEASRARVEALNREAETLADESKGLRRQLVEAAGKVQDQERRLSEVEARLYGLLGQESVLVESLKARKGTIADLVGALESLSVSHPPALGVSPDDAKDAARSAMLLSNIIPELRAQARKLESELAALTRVREGIRGEQRDAVAGARALEDERGGLERKLADLLDRREHTMASVQEEQARLADLAKNAKDLRSFLVALSTHGLITPRPKPEVGNGQGDLLASGFSRHFALLKGTLRAPVVGDIVRRFGVALAEGSSQSRGVVFATRENAQVVAPCAGTVVFSGPFRGYGLLLIIQADDGYHFVLSGMARVDAVARQRLLAGEPVGIMGASGVEAGAGQAPQLYVELRRRGEPVDPLPWLAQAGGKVNG